MKKFLAIVLCATILSGCAGQKKVSTVSGPIGVINTETAKATPAQKNKAREVSETELIKAIEERVEKRITGIYYRYREDGTKDSTDYERPFKGRLSDIEILSIEKTGDLGKYKAKLLANISNKYFKLIDKKNLFVDYTVTEDEIVLSGTFTFADESPLLVEPTVPFDIEFLYNDYNRVTTLHLNSQGKITPLPHKTWGEASESSKFAINHDEVADIELKDVVKISEFEFDVKRFTVTLKDGFVTENNARIIYAPYGYMQFQDDLDDNTVEEDKMWYAQYGDIFREVKKE